MICYYQDDISKAETPYRRRLCYAYLQNKGGAVLLKLHIFGTTVSGYYLMMAIGLILMIVLTVLRKKQFGFNSIQAVLFALCVMVAGVLGCRVLYILEHIQEIIESGILESGFSFFGAVFLVPIVMIPVGKVFKLSAGKSTDAAAICVCAMIATIRIGCFLNGCCGGKTLPNGFQWPTQIMESVGDYLILLWLLSCEKKGKAGLYLRFMICYGCLRFVIEFFRVSSEGTILDLAHILALISVAIGLSVLLTINEKQKHPQAGVKRK